MKTTPKRLTTPTADPNSAERFLDRYKAQLSSDKLSSKSDRTRFRLKIATVKLLEKTGFQDLRVSDIAVKANLALGTFYVYFTDKNMIATEVMLDFGDDLYQRAQNIAHGRHDFEAILLTNRFFVANYQHNAGLVRCLFQLNDLLPEFSARWAAHRHHWIEGIARSIARRSGNASAPRDLYLPVAFALEGLVVQYVYELYIRKNPLLSEFQKKPDEVAEMLSVLWYRSVYCEDPPAELVHKAKTVLALRRPHAAETGTAAPPHTVESTK